MSPETRKFVQAYLGDAVICSECGAALKTYDAICSADLAIACEGSRVIEEAVSLGTGIGTPAVPEAVPEHAVAWPEGEMFLLPVALLAPSTLNPRRSMDPVVGGLGRMQPEAYLAMMEEQEMLYGVCATPPELEGEDEANEQRRA